LYKRIAQQAELQEGRRCVDTSRSIDQVKCENTSENSKITLFRTVFAS